MKKQMNIEEEEKTQLAFSSTEFKFVLLLTLLDIFRRQITYPQSAVPGYVGR